MLNPFEREENHQILFLPDMTATPPQGIRWNVWAAPRYFFLLETFFLFYKNIFVVDERRERTDALDVCPEVGGIRKPRPFFCWRQQTSREKNAINTGFSDSIFFSRLTHSIRWMAHMMHLLVC